MRVTQRGDVARRLNSPQLLQRGLGKEESHEHLLTCQPQELAHVLVHAIPGEANVDDSVVNLSDPKATPSTQHRNLLHNKPVSGTVSGAENERMASKVFAW